LLRAVSIYSSSLQPICARIEKKSDSVECEQRHVTSRALIRKQSGQSGVTAETISNNQGQQFKPVSLSDCSRGWLSSSSDVVLLKNEDIFQTKVASEFEVKSDDSPEVLFVLKLLDIPMEILSFGRQLIGLGFSRFFGLNL